MTSDLAEKLHDPEYRKAFVASQINIGLPFQVRALLRARGWTQAILAEKADMLQPRISGLMSPGKTRPNIDTLRRLAEAFDCGLAVRFVPFSELAAWSEQFDPESFSVPDFGHDLGFIERNEPEKATTMATSGTAIEGPDIHRDATRPNAWAQAYTSASESIPPSDWCVRPQLSGQAVVFQLDRPMPGISPRQTASANAQSIGAGGGSEILQRAAPLGVRRRLWEAPSPQAA
jgi:transcriptional regulator with XRE-family HTH domain